MTRSPTSMEALRSPEIRRQRTMAMALLIRRSPPWREYDESLELEDRVVEVALALQ